MSSLRFVRAGKLLVATLLLASLAGCSSGLQPVEGQVVWKDGTPAKELEGAHVVLDLPEKQLSARGIIKADGSFRVTTTKPDDGAMIGDYKVLIIEANRKPLGGPDGTLLAPGAMDSRYSDPSTSGLQTSVKSGLNKITLTVERNKSK